MISRLRSVGWDPHVSKLRPAQIANQQSWGVIPDSEMTLGAMNTIRMTPANNTTVTKLNPVDPGTEGYNWIECPSSSAPVIPAGRLYRL